MENNLLDPIELSEMEDFKGVSFTVILKLAELANNEARSRETKANFRLESMVSMYQGAIELRQKTSEYFENELYTSVSNTVILDILENYTVEKRGRNDVWIDKKGDPMINQDFSYMDAKQVFLSQMQGAFKNPSNGAETKQKGKDFTFDTSSAKTQVEADEIIIKGLRALGLDSSSKAYQAEFSRIRLEANVMDLPLA